MVRSLTKFRRRTGLFQSRVEDHRQTPVHFQVTLKGKRRFRAVGRKVSFNNLSEFGT
jgi:hypothetical protein